MISLNSGKKLNFFFRFGNFSKRKKERKKERLTLSLSLAARIYIKGSSVSKSPVKAEK